MVGLEQMSRRRTSIASARWSLGSFVALVMACRAGSDDESPCVEGASFDEYSQACHCDPGRFGDPELACEPHDDECAGAAVRLGHSVCAHTLDDEAQWNRLSIGGGPVSAGTRRYGKYLMPSSPDARLPTLFSDANYYRLHYCLMSTGFAPLFPGLTTADHAQLLLSRSGREFFAGATYEFEPGSAAAYGFTIETVGRPEEQLTVDEVYDVHRELQDRFALGELAYVPVGAMQLAAAAKWQDPPFAVADGEDNTVTFETYTHGVAYGRVRIVGNDDDVAIGWQDIAVFDQIPLDHEGAFAAAVTAERQDILSHLNVLAGQRGSPNVFVDDALAVFGPYEGQLVRLQADAIRYTLVPATEQEAAAHWEANRPKAEVDNPATYDHEGLDTFTEIATETAEDRAAGRSSFGAKTIGLSTLWRLVDPVHLTPGFGVPFHYYGRFMDDNAWQVDFGDGPQTATYQETIDRWLDDPGFRSDATVRKQRLEALRLEMMTRGAVAPELVTALREQIAVVFGAQDVMVRFRSSSNAEDSAAFNGAGLYESASACAADSGDAAAGVVSACDPGKKPRPLEAALAEVWASLWSFGAFDEREYYQLDHRQIAMGITVSLRYEDELANGVAFTGNPGDPESMRYLVNAQYGDTDVVDATPGITAELTYLKMADAQVEAIERIVESNLAPAGVQVVTDDQLRVLGGLMADLDANYPRDLEGPRPLLDLEFKVIPGGTVVLKQIRTFPLTDYAGDVGCR